MRILVLGLRNGNIDQCISFTLQIDLCFICFCRECHRRALHSPDKSGASLSVEEDDEGEEPSSPGLSGRGQDNSGAGPHHMVAKDLDSADEDF